MTRRLNFAAFAVLCAALPVPQAMSASGARCADKDEIFLFWNEGDTALSEGKGGKETYSCCAVAK